ncbi:ABC transporter permease subunit [[Pseudomonas] carboxydohydrogena]|uniref:ABC transporter permease subunit n=1 Tax=Afipia carboxydohydrogena TaxID=290 RepID=A0ABY8BJS0_AFICR|nr:ABC transporter permease subunit [[Pseudomonas] carboxydohydrogena]WEF50245.1 ABC transporter permease subunit [[Pseudomonas] carboxydohydrogena]
MATAPRRPPFRPLTRLWRALSGGTGWKGIAGQLAFAGLLAWLAFDIVTNAQDNLRAQHIASGFGFLSGTAGFSVNQALIRYSEADTYLRVFEVGLLNTLLVSILGIVFATIIGFAVALGRLSPNWLLARLSGGYVEIIRNLPLLFQLLFWYLAVLATLPNPRQSLSVFGLAFLNNRGFVVPHVVPQQGAGVFVVAFLAAIAASLVMTAYARRRLYRYGERLRVWPFALALLAGLPLLSLILFGAPASFDLPVLRGFNFAGGTRVTPEFVALTIALSTYTAAFIAEIVRGGLLAVPKGQMEAGASLGLSRPAILRLVIIPQAMRLILPPLTNQYLNLTKNSSLAVAIGYPDLFSVFAGTTLSQTGQAVEIIAMTMAVYLAISLVTSALMNLYGWRIARGQPA